MKNLRGALATAALAGLGPVCLLASGCDINGLAVTQYWDDADRTDLPSDVIDLMQGDDPPQLVDNDDGWPAPFIGEVGAVHWGSGDLGGATATFQGTGDDVCLIVDPQTVFRDNWVWTEDGAVGDASMDDYLYDDGDLDLLAGFSADYTGTPGQSMGNFERTFVDPNGVERKADFNLCIMFDYWGVAGGSAGRASPDYCTIETVADVQYTVALLTFSVPLDDDRLRFAFQMRRGACPNEVDECTLRGDADPNPIELVVGNDVYTYDDLEDRFCDPHHL